MLPLLLTCAVVLSAIAGEGVMPVADTGERVTDGDVMPAPGSDKPAVAAWLDDSEAEARLRLAQSEPIARAREERAQRQAENAAAASPLMVALAAMLAAGIAIAASRGWLSYRRSRPSTCRGLAIELGDDGKRGKTTVICLVRPERPTTARLARDRAREAEIRAAAAQPDDPPTDPGVARDTKDRIAHKHETAAWQREQRERLKSLKPATSRIRLLRRA